LKVSLVSQQNNEVKVICQVDGEVAEKLGGWNQLAINPIETELFAAASKNYVREKNIEGEDAHSKLGSI